MYTLYKHTCPKGRVYIGITSQNVKTRWGNGSNYKGNTYFTRAIKKYGWENFKHEIIATNLTELEAKNMEIESIKQYRSNERKYGFNISSGGESKKGTTISEKQKEIIRKANIGRVFSKETRKKLSLASKKNWQNENFVEYMRAINSGPNNKMYGVKLTDEQKKKRGALQIDQYDMDGNFINSFISIHEASNQTGISRDCISKCCRNIFKQAGGYIWRYNK